MCAYREYGFLAALNRGANNSGRRRPEGGASFGHSAEQGHAAVLRLLSALFIRFLDFPAPRSPALNAPARFFVEERSSDRRVLPSSGQGVRGPGASRAMCGLPGVPVVAGSMGGQAKRSTLAPGKWHLSGLRLRLGKPQIGDCRVCYFSGFLEFEAAPLQAPNVPAWPWVAQRANDCSVLRPLATGYAQFVQYDSGAGPYGSTNRACPTAAVAILGEVRQPLRNLRFG